MTLLAFFLSCFSLYAQDLGPLNGSDLAPIEYEKLNLDGPYAIYQRPKHTYSFFSEAHWKVEKKGYAEKIILNSIQLIKDSANVRIEFKTESGSVITIPFYDFREKTAKKMVRQLIEEKRSIELDSCFDLMPTGVKHLECKNSKETPTVIYYSPDIFIPITLTQFESIQLK
jgi:hypothetical protein